MPLEKCWSKEMENYKEFSYKYEFNQKTKKPVFSIDTPPPYVNTPIHIGHATTYVLMDMFARFRRMTGYEVLFPIGLDRNGLPIEMEAEKRFNVNPHKMQREEFLALCRKILEDSSTASLDSFMRLGISFSSWKTGNNIGDMYLTDSDDYRALTQSTFIQLWDNGSIYESNRVNNYCPGCRTTIADAEIDYLDLPSFMYDVTFEVEGGGQIIVGTTRPELICSCSMILFNPDDERYKHLNGKNVITPIYKKKVSIKAHTMADPTKGTGLVMMCSFGDQADIRFFREEKIEPTMAIDENGMTDKSGFLKGMTPEDARKAIVDELEKKGIISGKKKIMHRVPICERSKHEIQFVAQPELYLKQLDFKADIMRIIDDINFYAPQSKNLLHNWLDTISTDWPISRKRYYGTEIPLWYCKNCGTATHTKGKYVRPWVENLDIKCKCGSTEWIGEQRILDTWFDSSISPLYILKYFSEESTANNKCTLRPQGKEIVRSWLYYTILRCYQLTGKAIFDDVWIHNHILDEKGYKMSKSLGNTISPNEILDKFGAEPFRFWCAIEGNITLGDFKCSFERISNSQKTLVKLWNVARFIENLSQTEAGTATQTEKVEPKPLDKWIINELNDIVEFSEKSYIRYDFHNPAIKIKHFIWETFASHYIELVKSRAYNKDQAALQTLRHCLEVLLKLIAPILPMMSYKIYHEIFSEDIHKSKFPSPKKRFELDFTTQELTDLNASVWKSKKERGMALNSEMDTLTLDKKFKDIEMDLIAAHHVKNILYE